MTQLFLTQQKFEEYQDYEYEVSGLSHSQYQIKVVFVSKNQAYTPIIKDLRAIAASCIMKVPIKDHDGWYKDEKSGAIQCADQKKYETYMKQYRASQEKEKAVTLYKMKFLS